MTLTQLENTGFHCRDGGNIHVLDGHSPGDIRSGAYGVGFGPLRLTPWAGSTVVLDNLRFASAGDDGWLPVLSTAGAFAAVAHSERTGWETIDPSNHSVSRRGFLAALGVTAVGVGTATAVDKRYDVASFDLQTSPRGLNIAVDDVVADYLPPEHTFYVHVDGTSVGHFQAGEESLTINPGITGEVSVESDEAISFIQRVIAKYTADDELHYQFSPVDESFAEQTVGDEIAISSQPILVDPIETADPDETILKLNGTVIPHADEDDSLAGEWYVRDATTLVYVVGEDAPDSELVDIRINVGALDRLRERF